MVIRKFELEAKLKDDNQLIRTGVLRNEHPLDLSPEFNDFLQACRRGDLKRCQECISAGVNINAKDQFDYTPLVVASLCGHYELVQLLLESGALADPDSFERERAVYNALNNKIRNLLLSYDYSKTADLLQPWSSHIASLLARDTPATSDITLSAPAEDFRLHKFLLSARSPYFMRKFADAPETVHWKLPHAIPVEAFRVVLRYLYLGDLPRDFVGPNSTVAEEDVFKGIDKLCKQLELDKLWEAVLSVNDRRLARQRQQDEVQRAQAQVEESFVNTVLKHKIEVDTHKAADVKWPHHNAIFADVILRADEPEDDDASLPATAPSATTTIPINPGSPPQTSSQPPPPRPRRSVLFPAHKPFLIRSPYFSTMFSSSFLEATPSPHLHIIRVDCPPPVLEIILRFLYTEKSDCPLPHALDLLYTADMLLLDKLKTRAAVAIATLASGPAAPDEAAEPINVYDVLRAAWDLGVQRLEEFAARYLAGRLEAYIDEEEFTDMIRESAGRLKAPRHETDTIELLDDIRYYLSERFRLRFEGEGLEALLDGGDVTDADGGGGEGVEGVDRDGEKDGEGGKKDTEGEKKDGDGGEKAPTMAGVLRTLNGDVVEDEFASDALNYQILMDKIEKMLDRLELGA